MDFDNLTEWFTRQGYRVVRTRSSAWIEVIPKIYQAFPYHWLVQPDPSEVDYLWNEVGAAAIRFSAPLSAELGKLSYHVVFPVDSETFNLETIRKKPRYDIRKGMKNFVIGAVPIEKFRKDGWSVRLETLERQKRVGAESLGWWEKMSTSAEGLSGFEAWAAYSGDEMAASALVLVCEDHCYIYYQQSRSNYLRLGVNNALAYEITSEMLSRPEINKVFYGLQSLDARPSVDQFKFRMGFQARPVKQVVQFHPIIAPAINPATHLVLNQLRLLRPGSVFSKAEGMFRFYLEGRKPFGKQDIPAAIKSQIDGFGIKTGTEKI